MMFAFWSYNGERATFEADDLHEAYCIAEGDYGNGILYDEQGNELDRF